MTTDIAGKVALITGASTGIGAAAARAFGRAGAKVVVHYNASQDAATQVVADIAAAGGQAVAVGGDVTREADVRRIVVEALRAFGGRIDVLVNNAGSMLGRVPIADYTVEHIDRVLALNCTQVALFVREVVPAMRQHKAGNIINVTSIAARNGGGGGSVLYAGAKAFVSTVTRGWAKELAGDNIRVNALSPGVITTPFHDRYSTPAQMAAMQATVPMQRLGSADECAGTLLYLASDAMSGYVTGQVIEVNGGQLMP
ncbi:MAG: SDR family oxidoreductase [Burkholderiales bacterium]|nr:SDR family oxidoreductase [Burkholderiales bacterium]